MGLFSGTPDNPAVVDIANSSPEFFHSLVSQQQEMFGENQTAMNAITKAWAPVLSSGAVPYGYSAGLDSMLQANVLQTSATATANAENAAALQEKQASGGANVGPTGSNEAINAEILARGQQAAATGLQQEKIAGYEQGVSNLEGATSAEEAVMKNTDPTAAANAATQAGNLALNAGKEEFSESQADSGFATLGKVTGAIGDVAGAAAKVAGLGAGFAGMGGGGSAPLSTLTNMQAQNASQTAQMAPTEAPLPTSLGPEQFHKGGVVRGKKGKEVHAKVLAGETILPIPKNKKQKTLFNRVLANA